MIELKVGKNKYRITRDEHCFHLNQIIKINKKDSPNYGEERDSLVGYYGNLSQLLRGMHKNQMLSAEDVHSLEGLVETACNDLKETIIMVTGWTK